MVTQEIINILKTSVSNVSGYNKFKDNNNNNINGNNNNSNNNIPTMI